MYQHNESILTYFVIKGISDDPHLQLPLCVLVICIYIITLCGNFIILLLVIMDCKLQSPMYFFLANLSAMDISLSTVSFYKLLDIYITRNKTISYFGCMSQVFFYSSLVGNELLLLSVMSYDRYLAICNPFHYSRIMRKKPCMYLALVCWVLGFLELIPYVVLLSNISCYKSNLINHFFCDIVPVMKLSCSNIRALEILIFTEGLLILNLCPCFFTFVPYMFIIISVMKIKSSSGKWKAFYTFSSHLTVVVIIYVTLGCQYLKPVSKDNLISNKLYSFFNIAAVPMLNPLIYSLRNKVVKEAFIRKIKRLVH
uniref:G-protein coupled receptors family 1 profile domain-containing protein n=1 Tax=Pyxicephalus adspersus TaxID=30357 RepID=A0AAV3A251_PYXAD|nr:TPA: hypothetical protein GDO54_017474 [Pyxicephalus adspersus]